MVELIGVSKKFGNEYILKDIDFRFESGRTYLISGRSGIGKTTLLNIIAGYTDHEGSVRFSDKKTRIGYMFQEPLMFSNLTVEDNLILKSIALKKKVSCQIADRAIATVLGVLKISHLRKKKISELSGGEKQRVQIAMLMFTNPDVILMDEPTANLDDKNRAIICRGIEKLFPETIKIVVSHEEYIAENLIKLTLKDRRLEYV